MMKESDRIQELKQLKKLAKTFLDYYISKQKIKTKGWEKDLIKRNIALLKKTIQKINANLHPQKVSEFLQAFNYNSSAETELNKREQEENLQVLYKHIKTVMLQGNSIFLMSEIARCSPQISYFNDLTWFRHGSVGEYIDYALKITDETVFEKYLPYQIEAIENIQENFFSNEHFKDELILLDSILPIVKEEKYIAANILIITLIEGLVRKFCFLVYKKQNPKMTDSEIDEKVYIGKTSYESLICNTPWKKDIPIMFSDLFVDYSHTENTLITDFEKRYNKHKAANNRIEEKLSNLRVFLSEQLENKKFKEEEVKEIGLKFLNELEEESKNLMNEEDKIVMIGLDIYLDFLVKKFKDDRNNIIHGKYSFFNEKWRTLVYLSALEVLIRKINWYGKNVSF